METARAPRDETTSRFTLGVEISIAVPPIRVWKALMEPADMKGWFCEWADVEARSGGRFSFGGRFTYRLDDGESKGQSLLGYETGRSVHYSWDIGDHASKVRYTLSAVRGDCRLRVVHECEGQPRRDWRGDWADHLPWENYLLNLKMYLERGTAGIRIDYENIPQDRHVISGEVRCASERIWRVLTDREECSRRANERVNFDFDAGEGWIDPFGIVEVVDAVSGRRLLQRWSDGRGGHIYAQWELLSQGVSSMVEFSTWGEGTATKWHQGREGLWTHLLWTRVLNQLKYYSETGNPTGLRRLTGEL